LKERSMDNREQEKSSSSPNVKITSIDYQGTDGGVLRVHLSDGSLFFIPSGTSAADKAEENKVVDKLFAEELEAAQIYYFCRKKALELIFRAEQYRAGLSAKLLKKGFKSKEITETLNYLENAGYLNDLRFSEMWARTRAERKLEGPVKIISGLTARGIDSATAKNAVKNVFSEMNDENAAENLLKAYNKYAGRYKNNDKLAAALVRKGYTLSAVYRIIKNSGEDIEY